MASTTAAVCSICRHLWRSRATQAPFRCPRCKRATGLVRPLKPSKYRNKRVQVDGVTFDSQKEARRWGDLRLLEQAGEIRDLQRQVRYRLEMNGVHICDYIADFVYYKPGRPFAPGPLVVEDVKSGPTKTREYLLKRKMMKAIHGIGIVEA